MLLGGGNGTPLQYSYLENPMARGAWWAAVHGLARRWTRLSNFTFTFHFYALEKEMAPHSSVLAWRMPGTGEPGGLPSMGSHRVGHDWSDLASAAADCKSHKGRDGSVLFTTFSPVPHTLPGTREVLGKYLLTDFLTSFERRDDSRVISASL